MSFIYYSYISPQWFTHTPERFFNSFLLYLFACSYLGGSADQSLISVQQALQATMRRKSGLLMAYSERTARSKAQERFSGLERPWELQYLVFYMLRSLALVFIYWTNLSQYYRFFILGLSFYLSSMLEAVLREEASLSRFTSSRSSSTLPPQTAMARLASFPLGSIRPCKSCSMLQISPFFILAEVPPIFCSNSPILTISSLRSSPYLLARSSAMTQVMILVSDAISTAVRLLRETMTWWLCRKILRISVISSGSYLLALYFLSLLFFLASASQTIQEKAETFSGGLNGFAQFRFSSLFISSISLFYRQMFY